MRRKMARQAEREEESRVSQCKGEADFLLKSESGGSRERQSCLAVALTASHHTGFFLRSHLLLSSYRIGERASIFHFLVNIRQVTCLCGDHMSGEKFHSISIDILNGFFRRESLFRFIARFQIFTSQSLED